MGVDRMYLLNCYLKFMFYSIHIGSGGGLKKYSPRMFGEKMIHFDGPHMFQRCWFNHQLPSLKLTAKAHENPIFPGKYHQNGGFSMAMLVSGSVDVSSHSVSILLANYPTT